MAETNGATPSRTEMRIATLSSDVHRQLLRVVRELPQHWHTMTGAAQQDVIDKLATMTDRIIDEAVDIVASRGFKDMIVRLGPITISDRKITCKFEVDQTNENVMTLCARQHLGAVLVPCDPEDFKKDKTAIETDNVGELAIPRDRPTPLMMDEQHASRPS